MATQTFRGNISIQGGATTAGGKITLKGGLNGASADFADWHIESASAEFRLTAGSTTRFSFSDSSGFAELTGNMRVTGTLTFGAGTIASMTQSNTQAGQPFASGPQLQGDTGWSFYHLGAGSHRMGFRGSASPYSTKYFWCADNALFGSQPDDGAIISNYNFIGTMRVTGTLTASGALTVGGTTTVGTINGTTANITTYNGSYVVPTAIGNSDWNNNAIIINSGATQACMSFHPGGVAPQIRVGTGDNNMYFRNSNNSAYVTVVAVIFDQSSEKTKQDIAEWPPRAERAVMRGLFAAAAKPTEPVAPETPGLNKVMLLKPKFFRRSHDEWLRHVRVDEEDGPHECGRDCDYSPLNPCPRVRDWQKGNVGLIAEEVYEVFPEAVSLDAEGSPIAINPTAISTAAIAAIQDVRNVQQYILDKINLLEKKEK